MEYGKKPLWQWILIYLVVAAVVYGAIYYFVLAKPGGYNSTSTPNNPSNSQSPPNTPPSSSY